MTNKSNSEDGQRGMNIDVGHLSVTGHVVFAGRDGSVSVNTGGNVDQNATTTITVGGVETTREEYDNVVSSIREVGQLIESEPLDPNDREAAEHNLQTMEQQLTGTKRPNPKILGQAARALYRVSPVLAGAVVSVFSEPLVGQIVMAAGGTILQLYDAMMKASKVTNTAK